MTFERPDHTDADNVAIVMADGATSMMPQDELAQILQKQTGQSLQQLADKQENADE